MARMLKRVQVEEAAIPTTNLDISAVKDLSIQLFWGGGTGTAKLQGTNAFKPAASDWLDIEDSSKVLAAGPSTEGWNLDEMNMYYIRVVVTGVTSPYYIYTFKEGN